jgi:hypothetical protein
VAFGRVALPVDTAQNNGVRLIRAAGDGGRGATHCTIGTDTKLGPGPIRRPWLATLRASRRLTKTAFEVQPRSSRGRSRLMKER